MKNILTLLGVGALAGFIIGGFSQQITNLEREVEELTSSDEEEESE